MLLLLPTLPTHPVTPSPPATSENKLWYKKEILAEIVKKGDKNQPLRRIYACSANGWWIGNSATSIDLRFT
ncbi:hypothetical protein [Crocosphaera sp.]|uniref:hypothetical protein n=1 Tax=Crocosphaera sp. TaxID=2729996 RepID=UPI002634145F|nr:hypothetical protein [Crocosphaera sp.]MDJ0579402.1 hypothetical protein [Crocosphaera sp.]